MSDIDIRSDMSPAEIMTAAKDLQVRLDADLRSANGKMKEWQRAEQNYRRTKGTLEFTSAEDSLLFVDSCQASVEFDLHMSNANLLLATAVLKRHDLEGNSGAEYRAACKAVLASAQVLENAAMVRREICAKLRIELVEEAVARVVEAIRYARKCRAEIGFWWRLRL